MSGTIETQDAPIFTYALASADMRYIEVGEREIFLRQEQGKGRIFRGEIAGCGPDCYINLNEILLEYAMSCEGCSRAELATQMITHFGDYLGQVLVETAAEETLDLSSSERLSNAMMSILNSMDTNFTEEIQAGSISYSLDCCPLSECARDTGLNRSVEMAYLTLIALINSVIGRSASEWRLVKPSSVAIDIPMHKILIKV